ncbi:hypothetical protein GGR06_003341 [Bacteroides reticulotermitis]|uniref:Uncharacterized protein n=1 Tax=Bacteroides reticulotermitis TaxID=1133319 RepID=A0A840CZD6_9BACE|nr:hypothetical protein [Bacteroides reticulotermitis]
MRNIFKFLSSKQRNTYIAIARRYNTTPWHVYNLAHGEHTRSMRDHQIIEILIKMKIIRELDLE